MTIHAGMVRPAEGYDFSLGTSMAQILVASGEADFSMFEHQVFPNPAGVPLHVHYRFDEAYFVLDGALDMVVGEDAAHCEARSLVFVPRGVPHRFANLGAAPTRVLVIGSAGVQAMVEEVAPLMRQRPPDFAVITAAYARHDSALIRAASPSA